MAQPKDPNTPLAGTRDNTDGPVEVISVKRFDDSAIELTFKIPSTGTGSNRLLYSDNETSLDVVEQGLP